MAGGNVFNVQRYSVQDGPGIRTTVFLKGCPLHCPWCHNPEGLSPRRELYFVETLCVRCGECRRACPRCALGGYQTPATPLPPRLEGCELCGQCVEACPPGARRFAGEEMTARQVLELLLQDRIFFEESGGGVTFSGGEPLMQPAFLMELLQACRGEGLHTAVDTSGYCKTEDLLAVAPLTNLFLFDLKLHDEAAHRRFTGVSNRLIQENLSALSQVHAAIWIRVPIIPGVNDSPGEIRAIAQLASRTRGVRGLTLLPFHKIGSHKFPRLGITPPPYDFTPPAAAIFEEALAICRQAGLRVGAQKS